MDYKYAPILCGMEVGQLDVPSLLASELGLFDDGEIALFYAPFDYLESNARIAIVGVTPGPTQAIAAIRCAREGLDRGEEHTRIQMAVKRQASFKGMRVDLASWFDAVGVADLLGLQSSDELFATESRGLVHTTSVVRYPAFRRTLEGWRGWNGYGVGPLEHRTLKAMLERALAPELRAVPDAVIVPLGKANEAVAHLCTRGELDASRCLFGLPHPSPASARRQAIFAARRPELERQVRELATSLSTRPTEPHPGDR